MKVNIIICFIVATVLGPQSVTIPRIMDKYQQSGPYVLNIDKPQTEWVQTLAMARRFIWAGFLKHQRTFTKITFISLEGRPNVFEFFVEPDGRDNWTVSIERTSESGNWLNGTNRITKSKDQASLLNWISAPPREQTDQPERTPDPDQAKKFFESHKLQFVSDDKKIL